MAQTLKAPVTMELNPADFEETLTVRLEAIDLVRGGYVGAYLSTLNVHNVRVIRKVYDTLAKSYGISITGDMPVTTYSLDSKKFKEQMLDIARACRKAGI